MDKQKSNRKLKTGKFNSICDLTESDRQKAISELNESDDLECRISSLRDKIKASDWFNPVFEERLDDQYLKRYLRVAKMDEEIALERIRKMFALQKGTESQFSRKRRTSLFLDGPRIPDEIEIPYENGMNCLVILHLHLLKE